MCRFLKLKTEQRALALNDPVHPQLRSLGVVVPSQDRFTQQTDDAGWAVVSDLPAAKPDEPGRYVFAVSKNAPGGTLTERVDCLVMPGYSGELTVHLSE